MSPPDPAADPPAPADLRTLAEQVATSAAELVVAALTRTDLLVEAKTSRTDLVTEVDRASEAHLLGAILAARPHDGVMGEEGTDIVGTSGVRWLVDPIDGTINFVYGMPGFNVSVAAELDGEVVAGAVVDPLHGDTFTASLGGGAKRNGRAITANASGDLGTAMVATGFSYESDRRARQADVLRQVLPLVRDIRRVGAAATDLCWVACGRVDAYYERGLQPWDHAAGALIAREAGAIVGDLHGGPPSGAFALAATAGLFEPLRALLFDAGAGDA